MADGSTEKTYTEQSSVEVGNPSGTDVKEVSTADEKKEQPKRGIEYHWRSLKKKKLSPQKHSTPSKYQNLVPTNKDVRVKLTQLQAGSPPVSQAIFNDVGELIGTRLFTKYDDGIGQKEAKLSPQYTSGRSPVNSPFTREKRHSPEWDACASSSGDPDESKSPPSTSDHSHVPSSQPESECLPEHLHLDTTQESNIEEPHQDEGKTKIPSGKEETKEVIFPSTSGSADIPQPLKEVLESNVDVINTAAGEAPDSPFSPKKSLMKSANKNTRRTKSNLKDQVRHLEAIEEIIGTPEKMSYSQLIAILHRCNLKHDVIDAGHDSFFVGVLKQMQINGVGTDVRGANDLRRMLGQHISYENDYYKTVGDSFLSSNKLNNEEYALSVEKPGTNLRALDILATARFIDCSFKLIGVLGEWSNEELVERIAHPDVKVTMIVYSPGEFYSTKPNLVRPSRRKTIAKLVESAKEKGDTKEIGRVTLDLLSAPTQPCAASTSKEGRLETYRESTSPKTSNIQDPPPEKHSRQPSSSSDSDRDDCTRNDEVKSDAPKSAPRKKRATPSILRRLKENVVHASHPPAVTTPRQLRSADSSDSTIQGSLKSRSTPSSSRTKEPSSDATAIHDLRSRQLRTSQSGKSPSHFKRRRSKQDSVSKSPTTDKNRMKSTAKTSESAASSNTKSSRKPGRSLESSTSATSRTTSSSDETDFAAINLEKLSPKDTTYFLGRTVNVIEKLRRKLKQERANKERSTATGKSQKSPASSQPSSTVSSSNVARSTRSSTQSAGATKKVVATKSSSSSSVSSASCKGRSLFACRLCDRIFSSRSALADHKRKDHPKRYSCNKCPKNYASQSGLSQHKLVHEDISFDCDMCSKKFRRKDRLSSHIKSHLGEYRYLCVTCGKGFDRKNHYEGHMMRHLNIRSHQCPNCNKCFFYRHDQQHHTRNTCSTISKNKVPCDICGSEFKTRKNMRTHRKKHTGFEKFVCALCGKIFVSKYGYKLHIKRCKGLHVAK